MRPSTALPALAAASLAVFLFVPGPVDLHAGNEPAGVLRPAPWLIQGDQGGAAFGQSTAPAGDVDGDGYGDLLVGAPLHDGPAGTDAGAAFLYRGSAIGFVTTPSWTYDGPQAGAQTGTVVAPAGDVNGDGYLDVIVTTPLFDTSGPVIVDAGRFDLFYGSEDGLSLTPDVTRFGQQAGVKLGFAAAPAGDVNGDGYADIILGMPNAFSFFTHDGTSWIYHGHSTGLLGPQWSTIGGAANEQFGYAVAGAGDVDGDGYDDVLVGAPGTSTFGPADGSVYLYRGSSGGVSMAAFATRHGFSDSCRFGAAVAGAGDVDGDGYADVVIGAPGATNGGSKPGWAAIVRGSSSGFGTNFWSSFGFLDGERFGVTVATAGDLNGDDRGDVVVGADRWPTPGDRRGRAVVLLGGGSGPVVDTNVFGTATGEALGVSVATVGDGDGDGMSDLVIGVPGAVGSEVGAGRLGLWRGGASLPSEAPSWPVADAETGAAFGLAVTGGIDARGAGVDDLFLAAPYANAGFTDAGAIRTAESAWPAPVLAPGNEVTGTQFAAILGNELARAGDVNGDGHEDLIQGSARYSTGTPEEGIAQLFLGVTGGLHPTAAWSFEGPATYFNAGHDVDAGDFNGDGYHDLLVGSFTANGNTYDGTARVFRGGPGGPENTASWITPPITGDTWYGFRVAVGDWDADGYDDVAVAGPSASLPQFHEGVVDVYFGSQAGLAVTPAWRLQRDHVMGTFGHGVADAGDVNGDGVSDLLVGATGISGGRAFVYFGNRARTQPDFLHSRQFAPDVSTTTFGTAVMGVGDVDKDGFGDFVVGAPQYANGQSNEGAVFLYRGSVLGGDLLPWWKAESNVAEAFFGYSLARAGDTNQDGWPDFVVGAFSQPPGGAVHLFLGGGGSPLHATIQATPSGNLLPVPMGARMPANALAATASFRSAAGRTKGSIELQLGTQNEAWGAGARTLHGPYDSGAPGLYGSLFPVQIVKPALPDGVGWRWRERSVTKSPYFPHSPWRQPRAFETAQPHFRTGGTNVAVESRPGAGALAFVGIDPSPARAACRFSFRLERATTLSLEVTDVRGRAVRRIALGERPVGDGAIVFDGRDESGAPLAAGVYFATLATGDGRATRKFVRLP